MEVTHIVRDLLIILTAGVFAGVICKRVGLPTVIGYMLIGVVIGPGSLGFVLKETGGSHHLEEIGHLAEIGVFLLLFAIGLEFSLDELVRLGRHILIGGATQMLLVAAPIVAALSWFNYPWQAAIIIGSAAAFSSTVLVFRNLAEWGQTDAPAGRRAVGVLLFQDAALVPLLLLTPLLAGETTSIAGSDILQLVISSCGFLVAVISLRAILRSWLIPSIARYRSSELIVLTAMVTILAVTYGSHQIGLPPAVGAFAAGLMLSGNRWSGQFDALVLPFRETFGAVFFVSLGMLLEPSVLFANPLLSVSLLLGLIGLKTLAGGIALKLTGLSWRACLGMGVGLAHVGEFAFILLAMGQDSGLLTPERVQIFVATGLVSLLVSPGLLAWGIRFARVGSESEATNKRRFDPGDSEVSQAIVIGIGAIGGQIASLLETTGQDVCLVDQSPLNLQPFLQTGFRAIAGDGTDPAILLHAGINDASAVIVCVPDDEVAKQILRTIRGINRRCRMIVRCRYHNNEREMRKFGAAQVVSEEAEAFGALKKIILG